MSLLSFYQSTVYTYIVFRYGIDITYIYVHIYAYMPEKVKYKNREIVKCENREIETLKNKEIEK